MFSLSRQRGARFEYQARLFLESKGLQFIAANQSFKCGELDLIMLDQETIVFIEVRQRRNNRFGSAIESVDWYKQQKWLNAANLWLAQQERSLEDTDCRFDLIAFGKTTQDIEWIMNFLDE
ncbi:YraN family protein [Pasteurella canis]|uniref:YraN family protein n=1 Tax=Pasteurella canis TaxID=753 RepID=UPI001E615870|nr:YraN family protein [Pasteurella canis]UEA17574.1 YraN family protein [Pasteurella canis]